MKAIISATEGPLVRVAVNGVFYALTTGSEITITAAQLEALTNAGISFERTYRTENVTMATLTLDNDTFADDATEDDPVGTFSGSLAGSTLSLTADASSGMVALDGSDLVVGATALVADDYEITITETNDEIAEGSKETDITITVTAA